MASTGDDKRRRAAVTTRVTGMPDLAHKTRFVARLQLFAVRLWLVRRRASLHTAGVAGSNPAPPTKEIKDLRHLRVAFAFRVS